MTEAVSPGAIAARQRSLFERLGELGIVTETHTHAPVFTVEESRRERGRLPGAHCKSLFLKDKKGVLWLRSSRWRIAAWTSRRSLRSSGRRGCPSAARNGSPTVSASCRAPSTPFALINDDKHEVRPVIDSGVTEAERAYFHPLSNDATTAIAPEDLLRFIRALGHDPMVVDLGDAAAE